MMCGDSQRTMSLAKGKFEPLAEGDDIVLGSDVLKTLHPAIRNSCTPTSLNPYNSLSPDIALDAAQAGTHMRTDLVRIRARTLHCTRTARCTARCG